MRIRGKSNIIEVKTGSLKHTIYEQNNYISMKQKRKIANNRRRKMEMLERYKEERLINELRIIKEQKKVLKEQQKLEIIKERRRQAHAQSLKERLEELRITKLEEEIRFLKPKERSQFKSMLKYGEV